MLLPSALSLKVLSSRGVHEQSISQRLAGGVRFDGAGPVFGKPVYIMAFTNRCGSNLLADYLRQTGEFGGFHESLNYDTVETTCKREGLVSFPAYIEWLVRSVAGSKSLGLKASWDQVLMLHRQNILSMFPDVRVIHIRRSDVVSQAVSHLIADQTNRWTSAMRASSDIPVQYDFAKLMAIVDNINHANSVLPVIFGTLGLKSVGVLYEGLVRDPKAVVSGLGGAISMDLSTWSPGAPKIRRQSDALNQSFKHRFRNDLLGLMRGVGISNPSE